MLHEDTSYGLLTYDTSNIGDDIQSLAARQFLPKVDLLFNREKLHVASAEDVRSKVILNGWFMHNIQNWPPSHNIEPLFVSFHTRKKDLLRGRGGEYLKSYEPIGCRDHATVELLEQNGIKAYYTGCLTLTLKRDASIRKEDLVVFCDPFGHDKNFRFYQPGDSQYDYWFDRVFKSELSGSATEFVTHIIQRDLSPAERFAQAESFLVKYQKARLVVTSRIHCALPCIAFGTPVLFIEPRRPQELRYPLIYRLVAPLLKYRNKSSDSRFHGITSLMHKRSMADVEKGKLEFDLRNPPSNPVSVESIRKNLIALCQEFVSDTERATM